jgi:glycosyltransferase involved in cell wall biosynthesis
MRIAYVTRHDPLDIRRLSGTGYYIAQSLKDESTSLEFIGPLKNGHAFPAFVKSVYYNGLIRKRYLWDREPAILKDYAGQVATRLSGMSPGADVVLSPGTIPIAYLDCARPIVFWTDSAFAGMIDFYPGFSNLCEETVINGNAMEKSALDRCALAVYSNDWAAETAINCYKIPPDKVKVIPRGANLECGRSLDDIKSIAGSRPSKICKLLFLGVDWARKGGDIAVKVTEELNRSGLPAELTVAGCRPRAGERLPGFVKILGYLDKSTREGRERIDGLLSESHFLIMPSRAECSGIVFPEANSFGVPCISTNVGGISTVIKDGLNGRLFSKDAVISEYCDYIYGVFHDPCRYRDLAFSSFHEYEHRLNWKKSAGILRQYLRGLSIRGS